MTIKRFVADKFTGLSSDSKPTTVNIGATFYETDTKAIYIYNGSAWVQQVLTSLGDINITSLADKDIIRYDSGTAKWINYNLPNPMIFKGAIAIASDFPTLATVQNGWVYRITSGVTDNDATKTNTGQSFITGDEIAWNGTNWSELGSTDIWQRSGTTISPITAGDDLNLTGGKITLESAQFDLTPTVTMAEGVMAWDSTNGTVQIGMPGGNVNLQLGQEQHIRAKATETITNGQAVRITGASGSKPEVALVNATEVTSVDTIAIATENVTSGQNGYFTTFGIVRDINTNHLTEGASVYLDTTDGALTSTAPTHPNIYVKIGTCIVKSSTVGQLFVEIDSKEWKNVFSAMQDPTGFEDRTSSAWTFTDGTRKLSVTVVSGSYRIWFDGVRHDITATKEITITDVEGLHAVYFDTDDTLKEEINPTISTMLTLIRDKCLVGVIYWDATNKASVIYTEERHGTVMDGITHYYLHYTRGLQYISGFALGTFSIGDGSSNAHAQFAIDEGTLSDEDIGLTSSAISSTTGLPILYKLGANSYWRRTTQSGYAVKSSGSATNRLYYNQYTGGAWQLTEVGEGNYVLCHVYMYSGKTEQVFAIMGQTEYTTLPSARIGAQSEISAISLGNLPSPEMRPIATIIYQTDKDYTNAVKARVIEESSGVYYINWLTTSLPRGTTPSDHQSLSNLLLAQSGVTYGHINDGTQTIAGAKTFASAVVATTSLATPSILDNGADITIENNTSDKDIIFKVNDGGADTEIMRIDGSASNVGIGTTNPTYKLSVAGDSAILGTVSSNSNTGFPAVGLLLQSSSASSGYYSPSLKFDIGGGGGQASIGTIRESGAGGNLVFHTDTTGGVTTERMRITSAGNVGIGTTSLSDVSGAKPNLVVSGATETHIIVQDTSDSNMGIVLKNVADGNSWLMSHRYSNNGLGFYYHNGSTYSSELITLLNNGNVGIGTTSPAEKLDVNGKIVHSAQVFKAELSAPFSKASATWEKISFDTSVFNTLSGTFSTTNNRFTASRAGYYQVSVTGFSSTAMTAAGDRYAIGVYINGSNQGFNGGSYSSVDSPLVGYSGIIYLDGVDDYVEIWMYSSIASTLGGGVTNGHEMMWFMNYLGK